MNKAPSPCHVRRVCPMPYCLLCVLAAWRRCPVLVKATTACCPSTQPPTAQQRSTAVGNCYILAFIKYILLPFYIIFPLHGLLGVLVFLFYAPRKISGEHIVVALSVRPSVSPSVRPYVPFVSGP